jgi:hypothetical protein
LTSVKPVPCLQTGHAGARPRTVRTPRSSAVARGRGQHPGIPSECTPVLDAHPAAFRLEPLTGYVWLQLPDRIREVHRQCLEFWYDLPGCAHLAFDHRVDVLRDLRKAGWIVLEVWVAEPGNRGHARRPYSAAQAYLYGVRARGAGADRRLGRPPCWLRLAALGAFQELLSGGQEALRAPLRLRDHHREQRQARDVSQNQAPS